MVMLCYLEGNRRPSVKVAIRHRLITGVLNRDPRIMRGLWSCMDAFRAKRQTVPRNFLGLLQIICKILTPEAHFVAV